MDTLRPGTMLLRKYRIDRPAAIRGDARVYDATDVVHERHVSVEVFRSTARFARDARERAVVDVGRAAGRPYVVLGEPAWSAPPPREATRSHAARFALALLVCGLALLVGWYASR